MTVKQFRMFKALAILAILAGSSYAVIQNTDQPERILRTITSAGGASEASESTSGSTSDMAEEIVKPSRKQDARRKRDPGQTGSDPDGEIERQEKNALIESKNEEVVGKAGETTASGADVEESERPESRQGTASGNSSHEPSGTEEDSNRKPASEEDGRNENTSPASFDLSSYSVPVRKRLRAARNYYRRAQKHYRYVTNEDLPLKRRQARNQKARDLFRKTIDLLALIRKKTKTSDPNVRSFFRKAQDMYGKCFRRAKMWGAY